MWVRREGYETACSHESFVSSVRILPKYKIRRNAELGGNSSDQSKEHRNGSASNCQCHMSADSKDVPLGHVLQTISFSSAIVVLCSKSNVRRRPETNNSVKDVLFDDGDTASEL